MPEKKVTQTQKNAETFPYGKIRESRKNLF